MDSQYAGNKKINFFVKLHSYRTKNLLHGNMVWTRPTYPATQKVISEHYNIHHTPARSMTHSHRKKSPVRAL